MEPERLFEQVNQRYPERIPRPDVRKFVAEYAGKVRGVGIRSHVRREHHNGA